MTTTSRKQPAVQMKVRTGLRSGSELDDCLAKLAKYQARYEELLLEANKRGIKVK